MSLLVPIKLFILLVQDCRCILQHEYVKQGNSRGGVDIWKYGNFLRQNKKKRKNLYGFGRSTIHGRTDWRNCQDFDSVIARCYSIPGRAYCLQAVHDCDLDSPLGSC